MTSIWRGETAAKAWKVLRRGTFYVTAALLLATLLVAQDRAPRARPNIVIILIDTLRADQTEPFGAPTGSSPTIAALAQHGTTFSNANSTASFTKTSVSSMLTSTAPWTHEVFMEESTLPEQFPYLPRLLQAVGYHCVGFSQNAEINAASGFARGFDSFREAFRKDDWYRWYVNRNKGAVACANLIWANYISGALQLPPRDPQFLYLHLLDPHAPYDSRPPYKPAYRGTPPVDDTSSSALMKIVRGDIPYSPELIDYLRLEYNAEVRFIDAVLKRLLELIDTQLGPNTVVALVSDHGEEFWDHGRLSHFITLYQEMVHVPLIFRWPGRIPAGETNDAVVSTRDLPRTLLSLADVAPPPELEGRDILSGGDVSGLQTGAMIPCRPCNQPFGRYWLYAREGNLKLIEWYLQGKTTMELYNLSSDPGEKLNLWPTRSSEAEHLVEALAPIDRERFHIPRVNTPAPGENLPAVDKELQDSLDALGYLE